MDQKVRDITENEFQTEITKAQAPILVDFYAEWCGPCKALAPKLEEIANEEQIHILKVNVDSNRSLAAQLSVKGLPTMILFKDGIEASRLVGNKSKEAILEFVKDNSQ